MNRRQFVAGLGAGLALSRWNLPRANADELDDKVQKAVNKGLEWVCKEQRRAGYWEANGAQYAPVMTSLSGLALLMEGSTLREGRYCDRLRKAVDWLSGETQSNGLIGNPKNPLEAQRYMYGHGFSMLFLSSVYGEEEDAERRKKLEELLTKAVDFCGKAQTSRGGWGYVSAADGSDFAEGSVTITQMQGLRAARNAGIVVPKSIIDKATKYLGECTFPDGQVGYLPGRRAITPGLTTAGVACMFNAGEYNNPLVKKWFNFIKSNVAVLGTGAGRQGHDEYTHYYYAQSLYILGDDGWDRLFPNSKPEEKLTWSKYRKPTFEFLLKNQASDGSWSGQSNWSHVGPIYVTAVYLAILQLDKGVLPIYQR